jgi:hypothetical protein
VTRRHFQLIADVIATTDALTIGRIQTEAAGRRALAEAFADRLAELNGRFDRERFLRACEWR